MSAKKFTWMAVEAYPLFVACGGACLAAGFQVRASRTPLALHSTRSSDLRAYRKPTTCSF